MLSPEHIAEAARRLVAEAGKPAKVILFGSYARGEADDVSDLDLMVVDTICRTRGPNTSASRESLAVWVLASTSCYCPNRSSNAAAKCREPLPTGRKKKGKCFMTPQREEAERFLRLAKRDQAAFAALLNAPAVDPAVCFHAQQAAEKALKAVMCLHGLEYRRTHDLEELAGSISDVDIADPDVIMAHAWQWEVKHYKRPPRHDPHQ